VDLERFGHPGGFRHPAHSVSMVDNDAAADLLDGATDRPSFVLCPWCLVLGPSLVLGPGSPEQTRCRIRSFCSRNRHRTLGGGAPKW
jgi:hypothetical protein